MEKTLNVGFVVVLSINLVTICNCAIVPGMRFTGFTNMRFKTQVFINKIRATRRQSESSTPLYLPPPLLLELDSASFEELFPAMPLLWLWL